MKRLINNQEFDIIATVNYLVKKEYDDDGNPKINYTVEPDIEVGIAGRALHRPRVGSVILHDYPVHDQKDQKLYLSIKLSRNLIKELSSAIGDIEAEQIEMDIDY